MGGHGIHRVGAGHPGEGGAGCLKVLGGDAVGDDTEDRGVVVVDVVDGELDGAADFGGVRPSPDATRSMGEPRLAAIRALTENFQGAPTSVKSEPTMRTAWWPAAIWW